MSGDIRVEGNKPEQVAATAEIYEDYPDPGDWTVFAVDPVDGGLMNAVFSGYGAEECAVEYSTGKFRAVRRCDPRRWPYL